MRNLPSSPAMGNITHLHKESRNLSVRRITLLMDLPSRR